MKLIQIAFGALAASLLPSAAADEPNAKPYKITFSSEVPAVSHDSLRYPSYAGVRGLEGACDVTFAVSRDGKADAIRVDACTSDVFRRAAKRTLEGVTFAPRSAPVDNVSVTIRWEIEPEGTLTTASLD